jgi:hypothetical protein
MRGRIVAHNATGSHALIVKSISPEELAIMRDEWAEESRRDH